MTEHSAADLLIIGGDVITMGPSRAVLMDAAVAVAAGRIAAIGSATSLRARFAVTPELDARGCVVIPGMVNAHQHTTADPLVRSTIPDDLGAAESISEWIMPLHAAGFLPAGLPEAGPNMANIDPRATVRWLHPFLRSSHE